jgi:predicted AlkP superfamily phosphohydrolase/phosphomutase
VTSILVIGIDGATFDLVGPWAEQGDLPNLARLMQEGSYGPLESTIPPVTSPAWPTFATGRNPGKHSVFDFIRPVQGEFDLVNASSVRAETVWQTLSRNGRTCGVMNVPVTYPPAPVNGFIVGGMLSPSTGTFTYPEDLLSPYAAELGPYRIAPAVQYKRGSESAFADDLLDLVDRRGAYALRLMRDHPADFLMFHFQASDIAQHALWKYIDPRHPLYEAGAAERHGKVLKDIYQRIDGHVGSLVERLPANATAFVMSDHGFGPLQYVVNLNVLFMDHGLLHLKPGAWTRLRARVFRAGLTPTAIWHLIERIGLQNYVWQISKSTRNRVVSRFLSFDDVDWSRTVAYSIGHVGQVYINRIDRHPGGTVRPGAEYDAVVRRVRDALETLRHPLTDQPLVERIIPGAQVASGPYAGQGPDLHVVLDGYRTIAFPLFASEGKLVTEQIRGDSGSHRQHGVFIAWGEGIRQGSTVDDAHIADLAPTILHLMGVPIPRDMDGKVLTSALADSRPVSFESDAILTEPEGELSADESAEVESRLRALGYLG